MSITWSEASTEVIHIVEDLIEKHHPHLKEARFGLMFRSEASTSQGKRVIGKASKVSEKDKVWKEFDFEIWISEEDFGAMTSHQRTALLDHELCHCGGDDLTGWEMVGHDIEEFKVIIERYGLWNSSLILAGETVAKAAQLELPHVREPKQGSVRSLSQEELSRLNDSPDEPEPFPDLDPTQPEDPMPDRPFKNWFQVGDWVRLVNSEREPGRVTARKGGPWNSYKVEWESDSNWFNEWELAPSGAPKPELTFKIGDWVICKFHEDRGPAVIIAVDKTAEHPYCIDWPEIDSGWAGAESLTLTDPPKPAPPSDPVDDLLKGINLDFDSLDNKEPF